MIQQHITKAQTQGQLVMVSEKLDKKATSCL